MSGITWIYRENVSQSINFVISDASSSLIWAVKKKKIIVIVLFPANQTIKNVLNVHFN